MKIKSFNEFLQESVRKLQWENNPKIGWWEEQDKLTLYHGTHERNFESVTKNGIDRFDPQTGMISMALEPNTALGYASMSGSGGETNFRKVGGKPVHTPIEERVVFVFEIPMDWIKKHYDPNLSGNTSKERKKMMNKDAYKPGQDAQYYTLTELRFRKKIPAKFIKGYMKKK